MKYVRSVLAVIAGLGVAGVLVLALTWVFVQLFFGGDMTATPTPVYLGINLTYSFLAAAAGGWVVAWVAADRPMLHSGVLAAVLLLLSFTGDGSTPDSAVPGWYGTVIGVVGAMGVLVGGWLWVQRLQRVLASEEAGPAG